MKHLTKYKLFESNSVTSVFDIHDLLVDIIQNYFYIEVNRLNKTRREQNYDAEITLDHDDVLQPSDRFNVVIMTEKLMNSFELGANGTDNMVDPLELFCWNDVKDSVEQLISSLSEKYTFDGCVANVDNPSKRGNNKHYYILIGYAIDDNVVSCLPVSKNGAGVDLDANNKMFCNVCLTFNPKS